MLQSRRCTSSQTDLVAVAVVPCSLLVSFGGNTNSASSPSCSMCSRYPCCVQETFKFLGETCKVEADAGLLYFYQVMECELAEIVGVGVALPDCAKRTPASRILSPDSPSPRLRDCYIFVIRNIMMRQWASFRRGGVACCRTILWSWHGPAQGAICWLPLQPAVPAIKDAYFLCLVKEKSC